MIAIKIKLKIENDVAVIEFLRNSFVIKDFYKVTSQCRAITKINCYCEDYGIILGIKIQDDIFDFFHNNAEKREDIITEKLFGKIA